MEIILRQDVEKLGKSGQVVTVKSGFARNFLIPRGLGLIKSAGATAQIEREKKDQEKSVERARKAAQALAAKLAGVSLTMPVQVGEEEKLYGSVTAGDLEQALAKEGFAIDKRQIALEEPIKALGVYPVVLKLAPGVEQAIRVWVVKK